jgi:hypothetical protein
MGFISFVQRAKNLSWTILIKSGQILSPRVGDIVDYGMGLLYRPARLHRLAGRYNNPYAIVDYIQPSGTKNLVKGAQAWPSGVRIFLHKSDPYG